MPGPKGSFHYIFVEQAAHKPSKLGDAMVGMAPIIPTIAIRGVESNGIEMSSLLHHISCSQKALQVYHIRRISYLLALTMICNCSTGIAFGHKSLKR
jgi:hypothetical protein